MSRRYGLRAWWAEYRYQRTKGHSIRTSAYRASHYQPPPAIHARGPR